MIARRRRTGGMGGALAALLALAALATALAHPAPSSPAPSGAGGRAPACLIAAQTALQAQGAIYSQGGAHPRDPVDPATGAFYPRTGPRSFDCSGLVWRAYAAAGVAIGSTTLTQATQGRALPCTLADLRGAATTCWAPGDLIFLRNAGDPTAPGGGAARHVAIYVGNGLFMDCYNHATGCILHDVARNGYYQRHFWQARRIVSGCETLRMDPGAPAPPPPDAPTGDGVCVPEPPGYPDVGVRYLRGCGPPVQPDPGAVGGGDVVRQFRGQVGWIGPTGRPPPAPWTGGVFLQTRIGGEPVDLCRPPYQVPDAPSGAPPPGADTCWSIWMDPLAALPLAMDDSARMAGDGRMEPVGWGEAGDPLLADQPLQLPPPGHPSTLVVPPPAGDPGGAWWSPGNDDRARGARCPLGGPRVMTWLEQVLQFLFGWLFGC